MPILAALFLLQVASPPLPPPPPEGPVPACVVREDSGGGTVMRYVGDRACVDFGPSRIIDGVWINAFEGSSFYEGAQDLDDIRGRPHTWLTLDEASVTPPDFKLIRYPPHAYHLTFVGKTAKDMQRKPLSGYGHMNMWPGLALVDRVTEWRDLGPIKAD